MLSSLVIYESDRIIESTNERGGTVIECGIATVNALAVYYDFIVGEYKRIEESVDIDNYNDEIDMYCELLYNIYLEVERKINELYSHREDYDKELFDLTEKNLCELYSHIDLERYNHGVYDDDDTENYHEKLIAKKELAIAEYKRYCKVMDDFHKKWEEDHVE